MTSDEARKLIGGYATGSLTDAERKLLFEAALENQDIFDELAGEHALKELLDEPGAKQRLIAALEQPGPKPAIPAWWARPWPWAAAATALAGAVIAIVLLRTQNKPVEIATAPRAVPQTAAEQAPTPLPEAPQPAKTAPSRAPNNAQRIEGMTPKDAKPEEAEERKEQQAKEEPRKKEAQPESPAPIRQLMASKQSQSNESQLGPAQLRDSSAGAAAPPPPAPSAAPMMAGALKTAPRFAFDYVVEPGRRVTITPAADGYLLVRTPTRTFGALASRSQQSQLVKAGTPVSFGLPEGADAVTISFSASSNPPAMTPSYRDQFTGTVEDPNPTPDSHLELVIRLQPRK